MPIVLDASAAVEWLLRLSRADAVEERLSSASTVHAPHLLSVEVTQVLRRYAARGHLTPERGAQALDDLDDLGVAYHPHGPLLRSAWQLRENLTAYDATYVVLARALGARVLTLDARLAGAPGTADAVHLLGSEHQDPA